MTRQELVDLRKRMQAKAEYERGLGDYSAGASAIRENTEALLAITSHLLEREPKR